MAAEQKLGGSGNKHSFNRGRSSFDPNYFTWPHPIWMIVISFLLWFLGATTFAPDSIPTFLGPLGSFGKYMGKNHHNICVLICYFTVILHSLEAAYAGKVCHDRGMTISATLKWAFSTSLFGFSSLTLRLLPYKPDYKIV